MSDGRGKSIGSRRHHGGPFNRIAGSFHMVFGCMNNTKEQFEEYRRMCLSGEIDKIQGKVRVG